MGSGTIESVGCVSGCVGSGKIESVGGLCGFQAAPDLGKNELVWGVCVCSMSLTSAKRVPG